MEDEDEEASETTEEMSLYVEAGFLQVRRHILDDVFGTPRGEGNNEFIDD
jgi:hypothetical protein